MLPPGSSWLGKIKEAEPAWPIGLTTLTSAFLDVLDRIVTCLKMEVRDLTLRPVCNLSSSLLASFDSNFGGLSLPPASVAVVSKISRTSS